MSKADDERATSSERDEPVSLEVRIAQWVLILLGVAGAALRAFPVQVREQQQNWPNIDLVGLAWLALVVVGIWMPNISEVEFGSFSIKTRELKKATRTYDEVVKNVAQLVQTWSTASALLVKSMISDSSTSVISKDDLYVNYINDRVGEAYEIIATNLNERVRLAIWIYGSSTKDIQFAMGFGSDGIVPTKSAYKPGEGMIGRAFQYGKGLNAADVRTVSSYLSTRKTDPPYLAVLCEPIKWGTETIGVVTVDRSTAGKFNDLAVQTIQGLTAQCALAISLVEAYG